jgi:hypothetical protein
MGLIELVRVFCLYCRKEIQNDIKNQICEFCSKILDNTVKFEWKIIFINIQPYNHMAEDECYRIEFDWKGQAQKVIRFGGFYKTIQISDFHLIKTCFSCKSFCRSAVMDVGNRKLDILKKIISGELERYRGQCSGYRE